MLVGPDASTMADVSLLLAKDQVMEVIEEAIIYVPTLIPLLLVAAFLKAEFGDKIKENGPARIVNPISIAMFSIFTFYWLPLNVVLFVPQNYWNPALWFK